MPLEIYNTLTGLKQEFIPINKGKVKMYVCGVTVYDFCHLGHGRCYVAFDVIYRYLKYTGYDVTYVRNVTDIDDKIINRANEMDMPGVPLKEKASILTKKYYNEFQKDTESLNLLPATYEPMATEYIPQMIKIVEDLIRKGAAYVVNGSVYFDVAKFKDYGKLSKRSTDELLTGARVEPDQRKRAQLDFCLWKEAKPNEPFWESPWGNGRPGWHLECSAMSVNLLGEEFDIHGGGQDLIFPHHENEIAQTAGCTSKIPARYWVHNGFVTINREKMSKSLGNFFTLRDIFKKYEPNIVRFFLLAQHYRSPVDFSDQLLEDAKNAVLRIEDCLRRGDIYMANSKYEIDKKIYDARDAKFRHAMDDDFNTAQALAVIFDLVKDTNNELARNGEKSVIYTQVKILREFLDILGVKYALQDTIRADLKDELQTTEDELNKILSGDMDSETLLKLIKARHHYKKTKQWALADRIRKYIGEKGYALQDTGTGTECVKNPSNLSA